MDASPAVGGDKEAAAADARTEEEGGAVEECCGGAKLLTDVAGQLLSSTALGAAKGVAVVVGSTFTLTASPAVLGALRSVSVPAAACSAARSGCLCSDTLFELHSALT